MAKDGERPPTAAEKGKGKVDDANDLKDDTPEDEVMKDKDGKPLTNGKKDDEPKQGTLKTAKYHRRRSTMHRTRSSWEL